MSPVYRNLQKKSPLLHISSNKGQTVKPMGHGRHGDHVKNATEILSAKTHFNSKNLNEINLKHKKRVGCGWSYIQIHVYLLLFYFWLKP